MLRRLAVLGLLPGVCHEFSQSADTRREFEVASIKLDKSEDRRIIVGSDRGGRFRATNIPVQILNTQAYELKMFQLSGAPAWLMSERYDVEAKAEGNPSSREMLPMVQRLLEDPLQLNYHRETKELPIYVLAVAKAGKLKASEGDCTQPPPPKPGGMPAPPCGSVLTMRDRMMGKSVPLDRLIDMLTRYTARMVIDRTGLTGKFDIDLQWSMEQAQLQASPEFPQADPQGPILMTALQKQLGLRLESRKGPVEMFVIDHLERPSEN